jgi:hypothetical protein
MSDKYADHKFNGDVRPGGTIADWLSEFIEHTPASALNRWIDGDVGNLIGGNLIDVLKANSREQR